jgi:hypothetical protein
MPNAKHRQGYAAEWLSKLGVDAKIVVLVQCLLLLIFLVMFLGGVGLVGGTDWPRYNYRL